MKMPSLISGCLTALFFLASCAPPQDIWGNYPEKASIEKIALGQTREDVRDLLGSPTAVSPYDSNVWIYVGSRTQKVAFYTYDELERRIIYMVFDEDGRLKSFEERDREDGRELSFAAESTPTAGGSPGALRQMINNVGRFTPPPPQRR